MNAGSVKITLVQRQLREDWNNREYAQVVSDNIRHIADFLCNFELSCRSRIATLSDKVSLLERKVEFLEARKVAPSLFMRAVSLSYQIHS